MKHTLLILLLLLTASARAQLDNRLFEDRHPLPDSGRLTWDVTGLSYLRDLEYFNDYSDGKTLFGQQLLGRMGYALRPNVYLTGGLMVQKDFGATPVRVRPIFTFRYENAYSVPERYSDTGKVYMSSSKPRRFAILFGTLEGNVQHRQAEPLQDFESIINRRLEEGFQILYKSPKTFLDVWLDWQNMIYRYSPDQEQIQAGATLEQQLAGGASYDGYATGPYLKLLGQGRTFHKGGQLDTTQNKPGIATLYMGAGGLRAGVNMGIRAWVEGLAFAGGGFSDNPAFPKQAQQGRAFLGTVAVALPPGYPSALRGITLMGNYWQAKDFYVPGGASIYSSVSGRIGMENQLVNRNRKLFIGRLFWERELSGPAVTSSIRLETFTDLDRHKTDLALSLYFIFRIGGVAVRN